MTNRPPPHTYPRWPERGFALDHPNREALEAIERIWKELEAVAAGVIGSGMTGDQDVEPYDVVATLWGDLYALELWCARVTTSAVRGWLVRAVRNRALHAWRDAQAHPGLRARYLQHTGSIEADSARRDRIAFAQAVEEVLSVLSPKQREVAEAVWLDGNSVQGAAAILGISDNTVKTHLRRAREQVRGRWPGGRVTLFEGLREWIG